MELYCTVLNNTALLRTGCTVETRSVITLDENVIFFPQQAILIITILIESDLPSALRYYITTDLSTSPRQPSTISHGRETIFGYKACICSAHEEHRHYRWKAQVHRVKDRGLAICVLEAVG
jgi:hypothetical protein